MKFDISNKVFEDLIIKGGKDSVFTLVMLSNTINPEEIIIMGDLIGKRSELVSKLEELLEKDNIYIEYRSLEDLYVHYKPSKFTRVYDYYGEAKFISINRDNLYKILKSNDNRRMKIVSIDEAPEVLHEYFFNLKNNYEVNATRNEKVLDNLQETSRLFNSIIREHVSEEVIKSDEETVGDTGNCVYSKSLMLKNGDVINFRIGDVTSSENPIFKNCQFSFNNLKLLYPPVNVDTDYDEADYFLGYDALENEVNRLWEKFINLKKEVKEIAKGGEE